MKSRIALFCASGVLALGFAAVSQAQDQTTQFKDRDGTQVTLNSGQPAPNRYGPAPEFAQLDTNHDGGITREEAEAFTPLFNDFDHLAHHVDRISQRQYASWAKNEYRQ